MPVSMRTSLQFISRLNRQGLRHNLAGRTTLPTALRVPSALRARPASSSTGGNNSTSSILSSSSDPPVLEKPARFNPPSHGARLPRKTVIRQYGGDLGAAEMRAQQQRNYPGMMPPKGTFDYWFWNTPKFHMILTTAALISLALFVFTEEFRHSSPFADLLPSGSDFLHHPIGSLSRVGHVLQMHEAYRATEAADRRQRKLEDVEKRKKYREAHGLDSSPAAAMAGGGENKGSWLTRFFVKNA